MAGKTPEKYRQKYPFGQSQSTQSVDFGCSPPVVNALRGKQTSRSRRKENLVIESIPSNTSRLGGIYISLQRLRIRFVLIFVPLMGQFFATFTANYPFLCPLWAHFFNPYRHLSIVRPHRCDPRHWPVALRAGH